MQLYFFSSVNSFPSHILLKYGGRYLSISVNQLTPFPFLPFAVNETQCTRFHSQGIHDNFKTTIHSSAHACTHILMQICQSLIERAFLVSSCRLYPLLIRRIRHPEVNALMNATYS